jgi:hypothetical protein
MREDASARAPAEPPQAFLAMPNPSFLGLITELIQNPIRIIKLWNWKSAALSIILRAPIFLGTTVRRGFVVMAGALLTETLFCALTAGFYGAIVQSLRNAEPEWLTVSFLMLVLPAVFQGLEYGLHWLSGTPHLKLAEIISVIVSGLSALFNLYAMRRGTLLVGGEGRSFRSDLKRLPALILGFLAALPRRYLNRNKRPDRLPA